MKSPQSIKRHWLTRLRPLELAECLKKALRIRRYEIEEEGLRVWIDPVSNVGSRLLAEGTYEKKLTEALPHLLGPNLTFYDVGANEGWFSLVAARIVGPSGRVIAVEPQERLWPVILHNASLPILPTSVCSLTPLPIRRERQRSNCIRQSTRALPVWAAGNAASRPSSG